jgi:hypothetical protein
MAAAFGNSAGDRPEQQRAAVEAEAFDVEDCVAALEHYSVARSTGIAISDVAAVQDEHAEAATVRHLPAADIATEIETTLRPDFAAAFEAAVAVA